MFVQMRRITVAEGFSKEVAAKFSQPGIIEQQPGFIDASVLLKKVRRGEEEVVVMIRWESEEAWKQWEKSDAHIAGHKQKRQQEKPAHILDVTVSMYEVAAVKAPAST